MRIILLVLAALATGCLEAPVETTTTQSSDRTFYSPRLAIVARITGQRRAADDLRAIGATKPPASATWTEMQQYRTLTQFDYDSADALDRSADALEEMLASSSDLAQLDATSQLQQLQLQQEMQAEDRKFDSLSNIMKPMHETTKNVIENIRD
jgi:hypothetical protein